MEDLKHQEYREEILCNRQELNLRLPASQNIKGKLMQERLNQLKKAQVDLPNRKQCKWEISPRK